MAAKKKGKLGGSAQSKGDLNLLYSAHQIWLAGLGAMSRAQAGAPKIFDELMSEGSKLQGSALGAAQKVVMQAFQGAQKSVNQRVDTVKEQASETWDPLSDRRPPVVGQARDECILSGELRGHRSDAQSRSKG